MFTFNAGEMAKRALSGSTRPCALQALAFLSFPQRNGDKRHVLCLNRHGHPGQLCPKRTGFREKRQRLWVCLQCDTFRGGVGGTDSGGIWGCMCDLLGRGSKVALKPSCTRGGVGGVLPADCAPRPSTDRTPLLSKHGDHYGYTGFLDFPEQNRISK